MWTGPFDLHSAHHVVGCPLYYQGEFSRALDHYQAIGLYDLTVRSGLVPFPAAMQPSVSSRSPIPTGPWRRARRPWCWRDE